MVFSISPKNFMESLKFGLILMNYTNLNLKILQNLCLKIFHTLIIVVLFTKKIVINKLFNTNDRIKS